jgi:hypothetical protein
VDGQDQVAEFGQHTDRDADPPCVGAGTTGVCHGAAQQQGVVLVQLGAGLGDAGERGAVHRDSAVDRALVGAGAYLGAVGPRTEEQLKTGDDHRLARAGLASDDGQPRTEVHRGVVDDPECLDAELVEHSCRG